MVNNRKKKPEQDRLCVSVQVLFKINEYNKLMALRRISGFPSISSYIRMLILKDVEKEK